MKSKKMITGKEGCIVKSKKMIAGFVTIGIIVAILITNSIIISQVFATTMQDDEIIIKDANVQTKEGETISELELSKKEETEQEEIKSEIGVQYVNGLPALISTATTEEEAIEQGKAKLIEDGKNPLQYSVIPELVELDGIAGNIWRVLFMECSEWTGEIPLN